MHYRNIVIYTSTYLNFVQYNKLLSTRHEIIGDIKKKC